MSRKDYKAIAKILAGDYASSGTDGERRKVVGISLSLSDYFQRENPRFDRVRFLIACGLTKNEAPFSFSSYGKLTPTS